MATTENEETPQVNGETDEGKSADADIVMATEDKASEETSAESSEVGFKKIFRFVGFKFTLKKDKSERAEPVKLLTVEKKEEAESEAEATAHTDSEAKEEPATDVTTATEEAETVPETGAPAVTEAESELPEVPAEDAKEAEPAAEAAKEAEPAVEAATSPDTQETQSPFKRFFTQGIFSNLRKKSSFKKAKEAEPAKEVAAVEEITEAEETTEDKAEEKIEEVDASTTEAASETAAAEVEKAEVAAEGETQPEAAPAEQEVGQEAAALEAEASPLEEAKEQQQEAVEESAPVTEAEAVEAPAAAADEAEEAPDDQAAEGPEPEAEMVSSQERAKVQGSPLKKLFTGAGLKKLSSKKPKAKKETKLTESGEQAAEQLQTSTESAESQKADSGPSSPEESGEHVVGEAGTAEAGQEVEASTSDGEKRKDGILSSFKKLVTPKKRVKRSSESEDEAPAKSATLSSTESAAASAEKVEEPKPTEPEDEPTAEAKAEEESAEPTTEESAGPAAEQAEEEAKEGSKAEESPEVKEEAREGSKTEPTVEEPKKKMDTSMSWEALICVGSAKKRARKTSDSEDEDTRLDEEVLQSVEEQEAKTTESPLGTSQEADHENLASSPEPEGELVSTWESFKRLVTSRKKKSDDKSEDTSGAEQTLSDSEIPKEESSFSLRKLIPRRKKKSDGKQGPVSSDVGSAEEDSDTPAVVPLSEYDNEPAEPPAEDAKDSKPEEAQLEASAVAVKASAAEDRSPSWISAAVDDLEEDGKQLSDIPEEVDTAGTPKSTDNTIAEDIVELTSEAVTALEQPPETETEMVSAMSRISASPATSGEATPVAEVAEKVETVLQEAVEAVVLSEDQQEATAAITDSQEKSTPVPHQSQEATTICTGLDTGALEGAEVETPMPAVEGVSAVAEVVAMEMAVEEKVEQPEEAAATEDQIYEAEVGEVQTEDTPPPAENAIEDTPQTEEIRDAPEAELAAEIEGTPALKMAVVSTPQAEAERLEEPLVEERTPEQEPEGPAEAAVEKEQCSQTAEVAEVAVAEEVPVERLDDVQESVAKVELAAAEEVAEAITEEVTTSLSDAPVAEGSEGTEAPIAVVAATEEFAVTKETVCVISSPSVTADTVTAEIKDEVVMEMVAVAEPPGDEEIQVQVEQEVAALAVATLEASMEAVSAQDSVVVEETREELEEAPTPAQADQSEVEVIEEQSSVIVQTIIQNVMENISEMAKDAAGEEEAPDTSAEPEVKAAAEPTNAAAEKPPKTIVQAVQITEVLPVSLPISIAPVQEEVAVMTVDGIDLSPGPQPQEPQPQEPQPQGPQPQEQLSAGVEEQEAKEKEEEEEKAEEEKEAKEKEEEEEEKAEEEKEAEEEREEKGEKEAEEEREAEEEKEEEEKEEEEQIDGQKNVETEAEQVKQEAPAPEEVTTVTDAEPSPAEAAGPEVTTVTDVQEEMEAEMASQTEAAAPQSSVAPETDTMATTEDSEAPDQDSGLKEEEPAPGTTATDATVTDTTVTDTTATDQPAEDAPAETTGPGPQTESGAEPDHTLKAQEVDSGAEPGHALNSKEAELDHTLKAQEVLEPVLEEALQEIKPVSTEIATVS